MTRRATRGAVLGLPVGKGTWHAKTGAGAAYCGRVRPDSWLPRTVRIYPGDEINGLVDMVCGRCLIAACKPVEDEPPPAPPTPRRFNGHGWTILPRLAARATACVEPPAVEARRAPRPLPGLACLRKEAGLTQADVGAAVGVTGAAVSAWERGVTRPPDRLFSAAVAACCRARREKREAMQTAARVRPHFRHEPGLLKGVTW